MRVARKDMPLDKEESGGGFERILLILVPAIFTIVLLGALAVFFRADVRDGLIDVANKIPVVKNWVPDPVLTPEEQKLKEAKQQEESAEATIVELKKQLAEREETLNEVTEQKAAQENKVKELETQIDSMQSTSTSGEAEEEDAYTKQIRELSKLYADMNPSKAAPIMQNLTLEEMVLMLSQMKSSNRVAILQKMDPKTAADATMMLKDAETSEDMAIAALQSRLKKNETEAAQKKTSDNLDKNQLNQTFAGMTPANAAELLMQTYKISPAKTMTILNTVDDATRSRILNAMSSKDAELAAKILNRLMGSK
ncbi:MotE family protein [Paenibacillus lautus]|uniref:kinesin n=1 Tax=Paenibacillus lautus TaxID=1401 RepID=UPI002DB7E178|nr:kinesin [Paenibacillus lautus]MEC0255947.1 kinesin [Paenibacillus lautus]